MRISTIASPQALMLLSSIAVASSSSNDNLKIVTARGGQFFGSDVIYHIDTTNGFSVSSNFFDELSFNTGGISTGDVNKDGHLDIIRCVYGPGGSYSNQATKPAGVIVLNNGQDDFPNTPHMPVVLVPQPNDGVKDFGGGCHVADLNNDGYDDLIFASGYSSGTGVYVWMNNAAGVGATPSFADPVRVAASGGMQVYFGLGIADLDGDTYLDLVIPNNGGKPKILMNDQAGGFPSGVELGEKISAASCSVGDVNNDGHVDIFCTYYYDYYHNTDLHDLVYMNDGLGNFPTNDAISLPGTDAILSWNGGLADLNGDGWLDVVTLNENPANRNNWLFLNDGTGHFVTSPIDLPNTGKFELAFGDVDQDGDIDMILRPYLLLNNGEAMPSFASQSVFSGYNGGYGITILGASNILPSPTQSPTVGPTKGPTVGPTNSPTETPTRTPTDSPSLSPTKTLTDSPSLAPTGSPTKGSDAVGGSSTTTSVITISMEAEFSAQHTSTRRRRSLALLNNASFISGVTNALKNVICPGILAIDDTTCAIEDVVVNDTGTAYEVDYKIVATIVCNDQACSNAHSLTDAISAAAQSTLNNALLDGSLNDSLQSNVPNQSFDVDPNSSSISQPVTHISATVISSSPDSDSLYYPDWSKPSGGCKTGGGEPMYMTLAPSTWMLSTRNDCCSRYFSWMQNECEGTSGAAPSGLWYPDWEGSDDICKNDGSEPEYMASNPESWMHSSEQDCCEAYFSWMLNECLGSSAGATNKWYMVWDGFKCKEDCVVGTGQSCGGRAESWDELFDTRSACCAKKAAWNPTGCLID